MVKKLVAWYQRPRSPLTQHVLFIATVLPVVFVIRTFGYGLYQVPTGSMETTFLTGERFFADKCTPLFKPFKRGEIISFNDPTYGYSQSAFVRLWQRYVWGPENWTKRIIGIPGDHVQGRIEQGKPVIYLNGSKLDEPYLNRYPLIKVRSLHSHQKTTTDYISFDPSSELAKQPFYRIDKNEVSYPLSILHSGTPHPAGIDVFEAKLGPRQYWVMGDNSLHSWDSRGWGPLDENLIHGRIIFRLWSIDSKENWWIADLIKHPIDFWRRIRWNRCLQTA